MKLRYNTSQQKLYNFLLLFYIILIAFLSFFIISDSSLSSDSFQISLLLLLFGLLMEILLIFLFVKSIRQNNKEIKEIGTKVTANIIDTYIIRKTDIIIRVNCFTVVYDNDEKTSKIEFIEDNDAYALLKTLLKPDPIKEKIRIPIDIYIYGNQIYADLESVDFTKLKEYRV